MYEGFTLLTQIDLQSLLNTDLPSVIPNVKQLGSGQFGKVVEIQLQENSTQKIHFLALKIMRLQPSLMALYNRELQVLQDIAPKYPTYMPKFYDCAYYENEDYKTVFILTEKLGYDLDSRKYKQLTENDLVKMTEHFLMMAIALKNLHMEGYGHFDIKPNNYMLLEATTPLIKLIDFGMATPPGVSIRFGSPQYMDPNFEVSGHTTTRKSDVYSLGVTYFELLIGMGPISLPDGKLKGDAFLNFYRNRPEKALKAVQNLMKIYKLQNRNNDASLVESLGEIILNMIQAVMKNRKSLTQVIEALDAIVRANNPNSLYLEENERQLYMNMYGFNSLERENLKPPAPAQNQSLFAYIMNCGGTAQTIAQDRANELDFSREIQQKEININNLGASYAHLKLKPGMGDDMTKFNKLII